MRDLSTHTRRLALDLPSVGIRNRRLHSARRSFSFHLRRLAWIWL